MPANAEQLSEMKQQDNDFWINILTNGIHLAAKTTDNGESGQRHSKDNDIQGQGKKDECCNQQLKQEAQMQAQTRCFQQH